MSTLAELRTRITRTVGLYGAVPTTDVNGMALSCINDALMGLSRKRKWYWWLQKDTTTLASLAAATESSDLPSDLGRIEAILDPDGAVVAPKTPHRQIHYPTAIGDGSNQTYAMGGISSTTRVKTILWVPPVLSGGDYVLWYYRKPKLLSADSDEPDLPEEFDDYLYWKSLTMILLADEERGHLIDRAEGKAAEVYREMEADHARNIETLSRRIYAVA